MADLLLRYSAILSHCSAQRGTHFALSFRHCSRYSLLSALPGLPVLRFSVPQTAPWSLWNVRVVSSLSSQRSQGRLLTSSAIADSLLFAALTYFALFPASNGPLFAENWLFFQVFVKFRFLGRGGNQDCSLVPLLACFPAFRLYCFARFRASNCPRWSRRPGCCFKFRVRGRGDSVPLSAWFKLRT